MPPRVIVYDPNWVNPYGLELSSVLADCGYNVELWCTQNRTTSPDGVMLRPHLAPAASTTSGLVRLILRRLFGPLGTAWHARLATPIIIVWAKDPWDAAVFTLRSLLGGKTICIHHNPIAARKRRGLSGMMEQALLRAADVSVVHSQRLANIASEGLRNIRVAAHPPYEVTTRRGNRTTGAETSKRPVVAYVGALRPDKGAGELLPIAESAGEGWVLRILGPDRLPTATADRLKDLGIHYEHVGSSAGPTDEELIAGLAGSTVMIAPYKAVTESGSLHLALSMSVPVLSFDSAGVRHIVNNSSMASDAQQLGQLLAQYLQEPWPTYHVEAGKLYDKCKSDWIEILNDIN